HTILQDNAWTKTLSPSDSPTEEIKERKIKLWQDLILIIQNTKANKWGLTQPELAKFRDEPGAVKKLIDMVQAKDDEYGNDLRNLLENQAWLELLQEIRH